jgi:hypothetical protein
MELDPELYFWLVDRGIYDDDPRNKVDVDKNKIKLNREYYQRIENG